MIIKGLVATYAVSAGWVVVFFLLLNRKLNHAQEPAHHDFIARSLYQQSQQTCSNIINQQLNAPTNYNQHNQHHHHNHPTYYQQQQRPACNHHQRNTNAICLTRMRIRGNHP